MSSSPLRLVDEDYDPEQPILEALQAAAEEVPKALVMQVDWTSPQAENAIRLGAQARAAGVQDETLDLLLPGLSNHVRV